MRSARLQPSDCSPEGSRSPSSETRGLLCWLVRAHRAEPHTRRSVMTESTPIVAFDQHAASVMAAVLLAGRSDAGAPAVGARSADALDGFSSGSRRRAFGAATRQGPCGFDLQRYLHTKGIACDVIAPALIPRRAGNRVKTDRRDAAQLAVLYRAGALTAIHIPTEQEEAVRDLLRCREDICTDLLRAKHRLSKFLLRHGRRCPDGRAWSKRYFAWLARAALAAGRARADVHVVSPGD